LSTSRKKIRETVTQLSRIGPKKRKRRECELSIIDDYVQYREIIVDDSGWGDLVLGIVIGALDLESKRYMERRIPVRYFQPPLFARKEYLEKTVEIVDEICKVMKPDDRTLFKVCSGYIFTSAVQYLQSRGIRVVEVKVTGELQEKVERGFTYWCEEIGIPPEKRNFRDLLDWVSENPEFRERFVKTGWKSWQEKWRAIAFSKRGR